MFRQEVSVEDVEDALFYLSRIGALQIEGGFLVVYNKLVVNRVERSNKIKYKQEDYRKLELFYENKNPANSHCWGICKEDGRKLSDSSAVC